MSDKIKKFFKRFGGPLITFVIVLIIVSFVNLLAFDIENVNMKAPQEIPFWEFEQLVEEGQIEKVEYGLDIPNIGAYNIDGETTYITGNPRTDDFKKWLYDNKIEVIEVEENNDLAEGFMDILRVVIIYGFLFFMFSKMMPGNHKNPIVAKVPEIKFDDIAGYEETKKNMEFLVQFLKDDSSVKKMGARVPKGVVLYGPPGTGKTLMAKAIAGSAGVPFYSMSGSDFVEMYVGLGASRVRNLYAEARKTAPCIVFIDEIDAVGSSRGQGHSEKDQTINALLAELDGFNGSENIITICATNRLEDLDSALIRPGRFDRQIAIPLPDKEDRYKILQIHAKNKRLAEDVDLKNLASLTVGFSGASIEALLNEAAIIAVSEKSEFITNEHIDQSLFKILMKGEKKAHKKENRDDIYIAAHHEAGHALAIKLLSKEEVPKVTIIGSTSGAGGVTFRTPSEKGFMSKKDLENYIKTMYAGRAAEKILFGNDEDITSGASNDIMQATRAIRHYLTTYGMSSSMGLINIDEFKGNSLQIFDSSSKLIDEATEIANRLFEEVYSFLKENEDLLRKIATELIERESLTNEDLDKMINPIEETSDSVI